MFYEITSSYFHQWCEWTSCDGAGINCRILKVYPNTDDPEHLSDYEVVYECYDGKQYIKDAWHFQIRYQPLNLE